MVAAVDLSKKSESEYDFDEYELTKSRRQIPKITQEIVDDPKKSKYLNALGVSKSVDHFKQINILGNNKSKNTLSQYLSNTNSPSKYIGQSPIRNFKQNLN